MFSDSSLLWQLSLSRWSLLCLLSPWTAKLVENCQFWNLSTFWYQHICHYILIGSHQTKSGTEEQPQITKADRCRVISSMDWNCIHKGKKTYNKQMSKCAFASDEFQVDDLVPTPACWLLVPCSPEAVADGGTYTLALRRTSATTQCLCLLKGLEGSSLTWIETMQPLLSKRSSKETNGLYVIV
jgi:hypothetical protein